MSLPKIKVPVHSLQLPSTNAKIDYRAFTVKEEKLLLMAKEDENTSGFVQAIKQVINNCIVTPNVDVDKFAVFDVEYFFLKLRSRSVGSVVDVAIIDPTDNETYKVAVDLDTIVISRDPAHSNKIILDDESGIGVVMKYPTVDAAMSIGKLDKDTIKPEVVFDLIKQCIDSVFDRVNVNKMVEQTNAEVEEWIESLSAQHLQKIQGFFSTFPSIKHSIEYVRKDGSKGTAVLEGIKDFFQ